MRTIHRERSILLVVDFQSRLMPAIEDGSVVFPRRLHVGHGASEDGFPRVQWPSRSATTVAQSVVTGARLTRIGAGAEVIRAA